MACFAFNYLQLWAVFDLSACFLYMETAVMKAELP